jgi:pantetheine-phosphate adenylyltransferase
MTIKRAIFPGSFDPFTNGHADIVNRSLRLFDEIIIAMGKNMQKQRMFSHELMIEKISALYKDYPQVSVRTYEGLTAEFAKETGAGYLIRGLRNTTDFEYENTICQANKYLNKDLETIFLITTPAYAAISSSIIRELYKYKGNAEGLLPYQL